MGKEKQMNITCKFITITVFLFVFGCKKQQESPLKSDEQQLEREQTARLAHEKKETIKLRRNLTPIIDSRKQRIKKQAEMLIDSLKAISADHTSVDSIMSTLEDKRGLEYTVFNIMTNPVLNELSVRYTGLDFSALKSEFVESVRFHKASQKELTNNLKNNREEYYAQIADVDQDVDRANTAAQKAILATHVNIKKKINELENRKSVVIKRLSGRTENAETKKIDERLDRLYQVLEVSSGSTLHVKATSLETSARRKYDTALENKTVKDAEALKESQFKGDLYNLAQNYRGRSLDILLNTMITKYSVLSEQLNLAELVLEELEESEERLELMTFSDLSKLRDAVTRDVRLNLEDNLNNSTRVLLQNRTHH